MFVIHTRIKHWSFKMSHLINRSRIRLNINESFTVLGASFVNYLNLNHINMGLLALVDYALIRELCYKVKEENRKFAGKLKRNNFENGQSSEKNKETEEIKRLLLSGSKSAARKKQKRKWHSIKSATSQSKLESGKVPDAPKRFRQSSASTSESGTESSGESSGDSESGDGLDSDESSRQIE